MQLAVREGRRGIVSCDISHGRDLVHGNELLFGQDPTYEKDRRRPERGYTLDAVRTALGSCSPPLGWQRVGWSAYDVFAGYLVLDALVANQDRHHENWGVLVDRGSGERALAPSFDHASSLAFMLTDHDRQERLRTRDRGRSVRHWAERGRTYFESRPLLVGIAVQALASCNREASQWWIEQVRGLAPREWTAVLDRVPTTRMSEPARNFANELIGVNRGRMLDACGDLSSNPRSA